MARLEDITRDATVKGIVANCAVKIIDAKRTAQLAATAAATATGTGTTPGQTGAGSGVGNGEGGGTGDTGVEDPPQAKPKRFYGSVTLDPTRLGRDGGKISEEILSHLASLQGAQAEVTLDIDVKIPDGVPDNVVRTVTENCRTLKFDNQGFEAE